MSATDYLLDSALVLLVLIQLKERVLTNRALIRPLVILGIAVASYFSTFPTQGNDLPLILSISAIGTIVGVLSGITVIMRRNADGLVTARAGFASAALWVLGMGSRFAFAIWSASSTGLIHITSFSAQHHITSGAAWTDALLGMAAGEVLGRTLVMVIRRSQLAQSPRLALA